MPDPPDPLDDLAIGYVLPTEAEIAAIWDRAVIAVDTNVLLNVYRYSPAARDDLLSALEAMGDRLFVPHQAATEYFHRRIGVLTEQLTAKDRMSAAIDKAIEEFISAVTSTHRSLGRRDAPEEVTASIQDKLTNIREEFLTAEGERLSDTEPRSDEIHERLVGVVRGRVGAPYDAERTDAISTQMAIRYAARVPPGYMDADKDDGGIGDLLLWNQLLDKAKETGRPIVLVTDDTKEDWVWTIRGRAVGPRPELVRELRNHAGVDLLLYTTARFLSFVAENEKAAVSEAGLEEAAAQERLYVRRRWSQRPAPLPTNEGFVTWVDVDDGSGRAFLHSLSRQDPGIVICSVCDPGGREHVWSGQLAVGVVADAVYPTDFVTTDAESVEESDDHTVTWTFVPTDEHKPNGVRLDRFAVLR